MSSTTQPTPSVLLQDLKDRQDIRDCLARYCVAIDRLDAEELTDVFHPDAVIELGAFSGTPAQFVPWVLDFHARAFVSHTHSITTHTCELAGDVANTHTYCMYGMRRKRAEGQGEEVLVGCSRYIDRFERRDGRWRIARRLTLIEWRGLMPCDMPAGYPSGSRDREDPSYRH